MIHNNIQPADNEQEKNKRLKELRLKLHISQQELAEKLGIKRPNLSAIENNKENRTVPNGAQYVLETEYNVNRVWFETGKGEMFVNRNTLKEPEVEYKLTPIHVNSAKQRDIDVFEDMNNDGPAFHVNIPQFSDCEFGKMVFGQSMHPTIQNASYIFCKPVSDKASFLPGEIYYLEYDNYGVCRRLQKGKQEDEVLMLPDNEELRSDGVRRYEPFYLKIDKIRRMYLVKGFFNQSQN